MTVSTRKVRIRIKDIDFCSNFTNLTKTCPVRLKKLHSTKNCKYQKINWTNMMF